LAHFFTHSLSLKKPETMHKFGGEGEAVAVVRFSLVQSFRYFLLCATLGEGAFSWSSVGSGEISLIRLIKIFSTILLLLRADLILWGFLDAFEGLM
jgi:hypothetical protein